jgi:uncharacterized protein
MTPNNIALEVFSISASISSRTGFCLTLKEIGGSKKLQVIVSPSDAQAIAVSMERIVTPRPLTHHFIQTIISEFEISLKSVQIYKYEDGLYYAYSVFEDSFGNVKHIDCRTSDAVCLALKMDKPIFALEEVFDDASSRFLEPLEKVYEELDSKDLSTFSVTILTKMLKTAIDKEDYEQAGKIQSELNTRK